MRDIPIAELYNKDGKMKLWHRISPAVKILGLCFVFAIITLFLGVAVFKWDGPMPVFFAVVMMFIAMFFIYNHFAMSERKHYRRHRCDGSRPHHNFHNGGSLDNKPEEAKRRINEIQDDPPLGT